MAQALSRLAAPHSQIVELGPFEVHGFVDRKVRVYLPPSYGQGGYHPTLVMFDGQNVFDDAPAFSGGWHLHLILDRMSRRMRRPPVVIGINHGNDKRIEELVPFPTERVNGKLEQFMAWVTSGLLPRVRDEFRLLDGPENCIVGGSSLGGLAATWSHFRHPAVFGGALVMSPSYWVGRGKILEWVANQRIPPHSRVYLDAGGREGESMLRLAERMAWHLKNRGYGDDRLMWRAVPTGRHSEADWRKRAPRALDFLFGSRTARRG